MDKQSLYEHCVDLSGSTEINEQQIGWSGRWTLMADFVVCSQCLVAQPIDMASQSFQHAPGCIAKMYGAYPWYELIAILGNVPLLSKDRSNLKQHRYRW